MSEIVDFFFKVLAELTRYYTKRRNASQHEALEIWRTRPELEVVDVQCQNVAELADGRPFGA